MPGIRRRIGSVLSQFKQSDQGCVCQISEITASSSIPAQAEMTFDVEFCAQHHGRTYRTEERRPTKREKPRSREGHTRTTSALKGENSQRRLRLRERSTPVPRMGFISFFCTISLSREIDTCVRRMGGSGSKKGRVQEQTCTGIKVRHLRVASLNRPNANQWDASQ